jgi:hypothetical protein
VRALSSSRTQAQQWQYNKNDLSGVTYNDSPRPTQIGTRRLNIQELFMNRTNKFALVGAVALIASTTVFAQQASDAMGSMAASGTMAKKSHGTTLHQSNKASKLHGASAARAASALGTNDKGTQN